MTSKQPRAWVRESHRTKQDKGLRTKDRRWEVVYVDPATGRRRTKGGFGSSKNSARDWAEEFMADRRRGMSWIDGTKTTPTFSVVARRWFDSQHFDRAHTANGYRRIIEGRNDLMERFGDIPVSEITTEDIKHYVRDAAGRLAAQTVRHRFYVLRWALDHAVESDMIRANPARAIHRLKLPSPPRVEDHEHKQKQRGRRLTSGQVDKLVEALPHPYDLFIRLLAYSGMRPEEACGLTLSDVLVFGDDLAAVHVHAVVVEVAGTLIREEVTKTPESNRVIALDPDTSRALLSYAVEHRRRAARWFTDNPEQLHPGDDLPLFVGTVVGGSHERSLLDRLDYSKPMRYGAFYKRYWHKARNAAGIPDGVRVYDLRHTHASLLLDGGALTFKEVQERLGHKDGTMLLKRYWHTREQDADALKAHGAAVSAAFGRANALNNVVALNQARVDPITG